MKSRTNKTITPGLAAAVCVVIALVAGIHHAAAQTWTQTSAPSNYWYSVASSADGTKLMAVADAALDNNPGRIYRSANAGTNWTLTSAPAKYWRSVASSADGTKLVAAANFADTSFNPGRIYTSLDSGTNWTQSSAPAGYWYCVASSADGKEMIAGLAYGGIYISTNSGSTWTQTAAPTNYWQSIASSADGTKLVAVCDYDPSNNPGRIYISTNSGATWTATSAPMTYWQSVASSADGTKLVAASGGFSGGAIYTSTDSGMTWILASGNYGRGPVVASSADGETVLAGSAAGGSISIALDSGTTWTPTGAPDSSWSSVASSAEGTKLAAVTYGGGIYTLKAAAPLILVQPDSQTVVAGSAAALSVGAFGSKPLAYQWSSNSVNLLAATNATLTFTNVQVSDSATYAVLVTNSLDSVWSSNAVLTVVPAIVMTFPADGISLTGAVLNGFVIGSVGTFARFEWGTDTNYGNVIGTTNISSSDGVSVTTQLNGLSPGNIYHNRLVASNEFGIAYGDDVGFVVGVPPQATTLPASGITITSATLNASVKPGGWETIAYFRWGTTFPLTNSTPPIVAGNGEAPVNVSRLIAGLPPSTLHYCYVTASNFLGLTSGDYVSFLTGPWSQASTPTNYYWSSVASSADGTKLVAAAFNDRDFNPGRICTSTNSGGTWTLTSAPAHNWGAVASSADGTKLVALFTFENGSFDPGRIFISTNSGATWTATSAPSNRWSSVASSADGTKFVAAVISDDGGLGRIYRSTNSGAAWTQTSAPSNYWQSVASSANGSKLVAAANSDTYVGSPGQIYISTNSGATWTPTSAPTNYWRSVACSADGTKLVAAFPYYENHDPGRIYISTDSGSTWTPSGAPSNYWGSVVCSVDGIKLVATTDDGIYASTNSGATWATHLGGVSASLALSADGNKTIAAASSLGILVLQSTPTPVLSIRPSGNNAVISWLVPSMDFVLRQNSDLTTTNWSDVLPSPILNLTNLENEVILPPPTGNRFYRLQK